MTGNRRPDPFEAAARELCLAQELDPDGRVPNPSKPGKTMPLWTSFRDQAREEWSKKNAEAVAARIQRVQGQDERYQGAPLSVHGEHEENTILQMRNCMGVGNVVAGVLCADGHLGYAQPVGGVIAYDGQISVSGVGYDIGCGNMAVQLDTPYSAIADRVPQILTAIRRSISFGVGRSNDLERVEHDLFDNDMLWRESRMEDYRQKARSQLGTVGSGNHYVDLFRDEAGLVWIGVHFGSRGLGHTTATRFLKAAGGKDGIHVEPTVLDVASDLGQQYLAGMTLAGQYAYAGREWVVERVRCIVGGQVVQAVHNHHNYAWLEPQLGPNVWVVRKGATPAYPGQKGFIGGSMGDDAVIIEGVESLSSQLSLYSTIHGAGRNFGRREAKRRFTRDQMEAWLREKGVLLSGGDLDESPMAYRRLPEVLARHENTIRVLHTLKPFAVLMAGEGEFDPFKD